MEKVMELIDLEDDFKYLVVDDNGYIDRLIEKVDDIETAIKSRLRRSCDSNDDCKHCEDYVLYIKDGSDYYYNDKREQECQYVKGKINDRSGVIIMRCEDVSQAFILN